jgi:hypothetical protein
MLATFGMPRGTRRKTCKPMRAADRLNCVPARPMPQDLPRLADSGGGRAPFALDQCLRQSRGQRGCRGSTGFDVAIPRFSPGRIARQARAMPR